MADLQRHRGPDYQGIYTHPRNCVALSHARLSINDLAPQGNQPMSNEDGTLWLICNGEIYNHKSLRAELEKVGHQFKSHSDSEVILHLYEEHGEGLMDRLRGMFAFVLYDSRREIFLCARDRLGKKPFVYAENEWGFSAASEIPALKNLPGVDVAIDPAALGLYLLRNLRHVPDPWTLYRGLRRLNPGHAMIVRAGRIEKIWRYWRPDFAVRPVSNEELLSVFDETVALRKEADVEVGALLSGGVDSSAVVQAMVAQGAKGVRTYAMGRDKDDDELPRARQMAALLGVRHKEFYFHPERQHEQFLELLKIYGEPIMLLPLVFAYELCLNIRADGLKAVITGHGADELFYGYSGHNNQALISTLLPFLPDFLKPVLAAAALRIPETSRWREALLAASAPKGQVKTSLYRDEARRLWKFLFKDPKIASQADESIENWLGVWFEDSCPEAFIDESNVVGLMHENSHSVTIAGDLPAMAASVEVRAPFLDQELVQLAWRIAYQKKIRNWRNPTFNKWILKDALLGRVPDNLLFAPKRGFGFNISEDAVLRGPWKRQVDEAFDDLDVLDGVMNLDAVRTLKKQFDAGRGPVTPMLIAKLYAAIAALRLN